MRSISRLFGTFLVILAGGITCFAVSCSASGSPKAAEGDSPDRGGYVFAPRGRQPTQIHYSGKNPAFKVDFDQYTGIDNCSWCHPSIIAAWKEKESFHARAFDALDESARKRPECLKCHVTGFNENGVYPLESGRYRTKRKLGYTFGGDPSLNALFEGVQCEACHGPNCGGKKPMDEMIARCRGCHTPEGNPHYKEFEPGRFLAKIKHKAIGVEEVSYDRFAGLVSCKMCHYPNFLTWKRDQAAHARAYADLPPAGRKNEKCLACHTTGFNSGGIHPMEDPERRSSLKGGFTWKGDPEKNAAFEGVQCEACHGINCGTYTEADQIRRRCERCHSGACGHDDGFSWDRDYAVVRHRAPEAAAVGRSPKIRIHYYDFEEGRGVALKFNRPLFVLLSNPPEG